MNVVFAVGCKRYRDPRVAQLKYADQDARRFVETVMRTQDSDDTEEYLLHDEHENEDFRPTRSNILSFLSLGKDREKRTELDFLFFYFSGHGWSSQDGTDFLLTSDSRVNMPEYTAISVPMLESELRSWEAKHVVLFIDACRTVMAGGKSITIEDESRIDVDSLCPPGMVTFCSCEPGQTSYEADPIGSGVFTEAVCEALGDEGRCSTIQELDAYLSDKVPRISRRYGLPLQTPYSRVEPLGVRKALIVSQRIRKAWQVSEHGAAKQLSPETTTQEESLSKYREFVKWVWTGEQLSERDVQRLSALASELGLSADTTADIERQVMRDTKEEILKRHERAAKGKERQEQLGQLYAQARRFHRDQQWQAVVDIFERIRSEDPDYPDPEGFFARAQEALDTHPQPQQRLSSTTHLPLRLRRERPGEWRAALYDEGLRHMEGEDWLQALLYFQRVHDEDPGYQDIEDLLSRVRHELATVSTVEIPDLIGQEVSEAEGVLANKGLRLMARNAFGVMHGEVIAGRLPAGPIKGHIIEQDPNAGTEVKPGSWVVGKYR